MANTPQVSVLVPVYNVENYIERCATSLFEQTYENIEYVFVDDCGTDKSVDVLRCVVSDYPLRQKNVKIISHNTNRGVVAARNTALDAAQGEFTLFVDSDDYIDKQLVASVVHRQIETGADIVRFGMTTIETDAETKHIPPTDFDTKRLCLLTIAGDDTLMSLCGALVRRTLYSNPQLRCFEGLNVYEDYYMSSLLAYYSNKIVVLPQALYYYDRTNQNSRTHSRSKYYYADCDAKFQADRWFVMGQMREFFGAAPDGQDYRDACEEGVSRLCFGVLRTLLLMEGNHMAEYNLWKGRLLSQPPQTYAWLGAHHKFLLAIPLYALSKTYMRAIAFAGYCAKAFVKCLKQKQCFCRFQ